MTTIIVTIGRRASDRITLELDNLNDAVEIYDKAHEATGDPAKAYLVLEKVDNGEFEIQE
jgi:hypothetical protein